MNKIMNINIGIELAGSILCLIALFVLSLIKKIDKKTKIYFSAFFLSLILALASNLVGLLTKSEGGTGMRMVVETANFFEYIFNYMVLFIMTMYLLYRIDGKAERKGLRLFVKVIFAVQVILVIVSQFTGLYYIIDSNNMYVRSAMFPLSHAAAAVLLVFDGIILAKYGNRLSKREQRLYVLYIILPIIALVIQSMVYGLYLTIFTSIVMAMFIFGTIMIEQTELYYEEEKKNAEMRAEYAEMKVALTISQVQPHFLYNALNTIKVLCRKDPKAAAQTVDELASFLRADLGSLNYNHLVPMREELETVRAYLAIEKKRFGDSVSVEYDIQTVDLMLPPMSIQPIAENAVKYGHRKKDKVSIVISSYEDEENSYVEIEDNGGGFDINEFKHKTENDDRPHIGIKNVRKRLETMCGGELEITTAEGEGTKVRFIIPKNYNVSIS